MKKFRKTCVATSLAGLSLLFSPAYAVTADDVACTACVGLTDIAGSAVNSYLSYSFIR